MCAVQYNDSITIIIIIRNNFMLVIEKRCWSHPWSAM